MKKLSVLFPLALLILVFTACEDDDPMVDLPQTVLDYIDANYAGYEVDESELETDCDGTEVYEVELEASDDEEIELTFGTDGSFLYQEAEISTADIPADISASISTNYADYSVEEAESMTWADGNVQYEIELKNGSSQLDVQFDLEGNVVCEEEDTE